MKIWIGEECDGFEVRIYDDGLTDHWFNVRIDQEDDSVEGLSEVFRMLGYDTTYEEVY